MAWYPGDEHESTDIVDEASVGLIEPKPGSATSYPVELRRSWSSRPLLSVVLIVSNLAWAGLCLMFWQKLRLPPCPALASHDDFATDFGMSNFKIRQPWSATMLSNHFP